MHILQIRPAPPGASGNTLAHFDAEVSADVRLYGLMLRKNTEGAFRVYAPNAFGKRVATFTPAFIERLTAAAAISYTELNAAHAHFAA